MKKLIKVDIGEVNLEDMSGLSFEEISTLFLNESKKYVHFQEVNVKLIQEYGWAELRILGKRLENDEEYSIRINREEAARIKELKKQEKEKKQLERLKAKYETND